MHKIKARQLTVGTIKQNYRGTTNRLIACDNETSLWALLKEHQHTGSIYYIMF